MRKVSYTLVGWLAVLALAAPSGSASAGSAKPLYARKWEECKELAKSRHFGVHWVKRNRWIRNCIVDVKSNRF